MTAPLPLRAAAARIEREARAKDFVSLARRLMIAKGATRTAFHQCEHDPSASGYVKTIFEKAEPGSISSPGGSPATWGGEFLAEYALVSSSWLASLAHQGVFDAILNGGAMRVPLRARLIVSTTAAEGDETAEAAEKPISNLQLSGDTLDPRKCSATVVVSDELLKLAVAAEALIDSELRKGVIAAVDAAFLAGLVSLTSPIASSGSVLDDLAALLAAVESGSNAKLFFVIDPDAAKALATIQTGIGGAAFPQMTPNGGSIGGVTVLVSDQLADGVALLIDATQIVVASDGVGLASASHATLELAGGPAMTSLWQLDLKGIRAERFWSFAVPIPTAIASLSGTVYAGGSPS